MLPARNTHKGVSTTQTQSMTPPAPVPPTVRVSSPPSSPYITSHHITSPYPSRHAASLLRLVSPPSQDRDSAINIPILCTSRQKQMRLTLAPASPRTRLSPRSGPSRSSSSSSSSARIDYHRRRHQRSARNTGAASAGAGFGSKSRAGRRSDRAQACYTQRDTSIPPL